MHSSILLDQGATRLARRTQRRWALPSRQPRQNDGSSPVSAPQNGRAPPTPGQHVGVAPPSFSVRSAGHADLAAIRSIVEEWLLDPAEHEPLVAEIDRHVQDIATALREERPCCEFLVAERNGVIGVCGLRWAGIAPELVQAGDAAAEVVSAYVRHVALGQGVGRALLDEVERRARQHGFRTLLVVSGSRSRVHGYPFWQKRYGDPVRWDEDYFGPGAERAVWRHELNRNATDATPV